MAIATVIQDLRKIDRIHKAGDYQTSDYKVGQYGITKILPYEENGQYCCLTFLAVYKGDSIIARLPIADLHIYYAEKSNPAKDAGHE